MAVLVAPPDLSLALDNDVFTHLRSGQQYALDRVAQYFAAMQTFPAIPALTIFEATSGIQQALVRKEISLAQADDYQARLNILVDQSERILPFDQKASEIAAHIFARLSRIERNKHWKDLFIVATAISHDHGLATRNRKDAILLASHLPDNVSLRLAVWN